MALLHGLLLLLFYTSAKAGNDGPCGTLSQQAAGLMVKKVMDGDPLVITTLADSGVSVTHGTCSACSVCCNYWDLTVVVRKCKASRPPSCAQGRAAKAQALATTLAPFVAREPGLRLVVRHKGQQVAPQPWPWQDPDAALELLRRALASTAYFDSVQTALRGPNADFLVRFVVVKPAVLQVATKRPGSVGSGGACYDAVADDLFFYQTFTSAQLVGSVFNMTGTLTLCRGSCPDNPGPRVTTAVCPGGSGTTVSCAAVG